MRKSNSKSSTSKRRNAATLPTQHASALLDSSTLDKRFTPSKKNGKLESQTVHSFGLSPRPKSDGERFRMPFSHGMRPRLPNFTKTKQHTPSRPRSNNFQSEFEFSAVSLDRGALVDTACEIIHEAYLHICKDRKRMALNPKLKDAVRQFVLAVSTKYNESAFHSFTHAVDVTQLMYTFLTNYFYKRVTKLQGFYLIIVCLCHDISHPGAGTENLRQFEAIGQESSLESYHIEQTLDLIENGLFNNKLELFKDTFMTNEQVDGLKENVRYLIDATDIMKNKEYMEAAERVNIGTKDMLPMEYLAILMKASDLANLVRDFKDAGAWAERLQVEIRGESRFKAAVAEDAETCKIKYTKRMGQEQRMKAVWAKLDIFQKQVREEDAATLTVGLGQNTIKFMKLFGLPLGEMLSKVDKDAGRAYIERLNNNMRNWHIV